MFSGICERDEIMPLEIGGRADKQGNKYEINCIIYEMLKVLDETNYSVIIEALGTDEIGTDILVTTFDGLLMVKRKISNVKHEMQVKNIGIFLI